MPVAAIALAMTAAASPQAAAPAAPTPATVQAGETEAQPGADITVRAALPDIVQKIDRRSYRIAHDAKSNGAELIALLRGLPAITIGLDDAVALLGSPNVTILVDNRLPSNGNLVLRSLHGAEIDHIEIMTNPSAVNAPDGTGGIINIVLRKNRRQGTSGTILAQADSLGGHQFDLSHKLRTGPWSFESEIGYRNVVRTQSTVTDTRIAASSAAPTGYRELREWRNRSHYLMASETIGYALDARTSLGLDAYLGSDQAPARTVSHFTGRTADFASFDQTGRQRARTTNGSGTLSFTREGAREGESLKLSLGYALERTPGAQDVAIAYSGQPGTAAYRHGGNTHSDDVTLKLDVSHPMTGDRILSYGLSDNLSRRRSDQSFDNISGNAGLGPDYRDMIVGTRNVAAVYVSFQQPVGRWTILPALRAEAASFQGRPAALPAFRTAAANLYPSLHLSRALGRHVDVNLSYARRVDRPQIDQLNPFRILTSTTSANVGNPALGNQTTNAYEANFAFTRGPFVASAIVYDRETSNLWSTRSSGDPSGVIFAQTINAGHKSDRGAEFDINAPVARGLKLTATVNLFDSRAPVADKDRSRRESLLRYTADATIDWKLRTAHGGDAGDLQAQIRYESARRLYQTTYRPELSGNITYSCPVTGTLSAVFEVENVFSARQSRSFLDTGDTQQSIAQRGPGTTCKIKLVRNFGT